VFIRTSSIFHSASALLRSRGEAGVGAWALSQMLSVGDRVEGRYGDGPDWFAGTIQSKVGPGVFSVAYDDGA